MARGTKIWVSLPEELLARLDDFAHRTGMSRSDAVRRAVQAYVVRTPSEGLKLALEQGYRDMAALNLAIALDDEHTLADLTESERRLSEAEPSGGS